MRIARLQSRLSLLVTLMVALLLLLAQQASADAGEQIVDRCAHEESISGFSQSAYRQALKDLSAGTEEYSDCELLISNAQVAAAGGGKGGSGGSSGSGGPAGSTARPAAVSASPAEQQAITRAATGGSEPVLLGGQTIQPGVVHTNISSALGSLPTPLLATLAFLLACALLVAGSVLRNRARSRHPS